MKTFLLRKIGVLSLLIFILIFTSFFTIINLSATNPENVNWRYYFYDKQSWVMGAVNKVLIKNNSVYVAGRFQKRFFDTLTFNAIAELNDSSCIPLGSGENVGIRGGWFPLINDILIKDSLLFVGGVFDTVGSIQSYNIGCWNINTSSWSAVGKGTNGIVVCMLSKDSNIFVGGYFDSVSTNSISQKCKNIAKWNGTSWDSLGQGLNGTVNQMAKDGDKIYVVGTFDTVGSTKVNHIGIWNDSSKSWSSFGNNGPIGEVRTICNVGNSFYFGGVFDSVYTGSSTIHCKNITSWNGSSWDSVGNGINGIIYQMISDTSNLYVVGDFVKTIQDTLSCKNIAMWNGSEWKIFGSGTNELIYTIAKKNDSLLVGGLFMQAGDTLAPNIGLWYIPDSSSAKHNVAINEKIIVENGIVMNAYPNPFSDKLNIEFYLDITGLVEISLIDITGNKIKTITNKDYKSGWHSINSNIIDLEPGVYICKMTINKTSVINKLIHIK